MSTIDEIMGAIGRHGDDCIRDADAASASFEALRELIAAALADAYRSGAESMRAEAMDCAVNAGRGSLAEEIAVIPAQLPGALPLPESTVEVVMDREHGGLTFAPAKRQAVLLTDVEVRQIADATLYRGNIYERVRAIETAVLAANGLEVRRG